jgi:hypothetical protein
MRGRGMKRCRAEGAERFALFVGAAVLANNLMIIGELLTNRSRRRRKTNRRLLSAHFSVRPEGAEHQWRKVPPR